MRSITYRACLSGCIFFGFTSQKRVCRNLIGFTFLRGDFFIRPLYYSTFHAKEKQEKSTAPYKNTCEFFGTSQVVVLKQKPRHISSAVFCFQLRYFQGKYTTSRKPRRTPYPQIDSMINSKN